MRLRADFTLRRGELLLRAALEAEPGETLAVVGPNGAGKTTLLRTLAGLERVDSGSIELGPEVVDPEPFIGPAGRRVGFVQQGAVLFPHMTALDNVAFPLEAAGHPRAEARRLAGVHLDRVAASGLAPRASGGLSGGERARVALARALAARPRLLLLDEPLAAVDPAARPGLRAILREVLDAFEGACLVVTHDLTDALALARHLVVLEEGRVVQQGRAEDLVRRPATPFVADLVGLNAFRGPCHDGVVNLGGHPLVVAHARTEEVVVTIHPRAVSLFPSRPEGSPRNVWRAAVEALEPAALDRVRVQLAGPLPLVAEVTPAAVQALDLAPGAEVWLAIKATEMAVAPA